jgi:parallel beta-helix repeat protein
VLTLRLRLAPLCLLAVVACSGDDDDDTSTDRDGGAPRDGAVDPRDGGEPPRDGGPRDAGPRDGGSNIDPAEFMRIRCSAFPAPCIEVPASELGLLLDTVNALEDDLTIVLGSGTFTLDNALTLRGASGITLTGQGMDETILDFSAQTAQSNGVDVVGDRFTISDLDIQEAKKDGLRVEDSRDVEIRRLRVSWATAESSDNGAYGIYPVRCENVLIEDSEAFNAADAGIYVGQSMHAVIRRNVARGNVAGIEIENTQYADVYDNVAEMNTAGIMVFDLPGNPIVGRDVHIHDNRIANNNVLNFAQSGTVVSQIPAGVGSFVLASRRVEINDNTYENNNTSDVIVLSGLALAEDPAAWAISHRDREGSLAGLVLPFDDQGIANFRSEEIYIHDNTHTGGGTAPDASDALARPIGALIAAVYGGETVDPILYDGIEETVDAAVPGNNTNNNHVCMSGGQVATLDLPALLAALMGGGNPTRDDLFRPAAPYAPYDCRTFTSGPIAGVELGLYDEEVDEPFPLWDCDAVGGICFEFEAGMEDAFLDAVNDLDDGTTLILGRGVFMFDNAVTIRGANEVKLLGQGRQVTTLDFSGQVTQSNGVDVVANEFEIQSLTIADAKKDGLRVEDSDDIVIRRIRVTWPDGPATTNGAYGIYPVKSTNVLVEECEAFNAADAGLYVGQVINTVVRHNVGAGNVAGLEIENTQYADVYNNHLTDNTGGLLIFDLPGNPIVGRDVRVRHNYVGSNNRDNFAQSMTVVSQIPRGTGTVVLASRRVEIFGNTYYDNDTSDMALLSGFVVNSSTTAWAIPRADLVGDITGLNLPGDANFVLNFATSELYVHDNLHAASGSSPDADDAVAREIGALLSVVYRGMGVDDILYDGIGENVDPDVAGNNTNNNHICVGPSDLATYAVLDIANLAGIIGGGGLPSEMDIFQPASPFVPFDCVGFTAGPIEEVVLP